MKRLATRCFSKRIQVWHKNVPFTGKEKTRKKEDANSKVTDRLDIVSPLERLNQHGRLFCMKNCRRWLIPSKEKFQGFEQSIGESFELKKKPVVIQVHDIAEVFNVSSFSIQVKLSNFDVVDIYDAIVKTYILLIIQCIRSICIKGLSR